MSVLAITPLRGEGDISPCGDGDTVQTGRRGIKFSIRQQSAAGTPRADCACGAGLTHGTLRADRALRPGCTLRTLHPLGALGTYRALQTHGTDFTPGALCPLRTLGACFPLLSLRALGALRADGSGRTDEAAAGLALRGTKGIGAAVCIPKPPIFKILNKSAESKIPIAEPEPNSDTAIPSNPMAKEVV